MVLDGTGHSPTLDGMTLSRVFSIQTNVQFTLIGVTIARGAGDAAGGLDNQGGNVDIQNCTFRANRSYGHNVAGRNSAGGAIYCSGGSLQVRDSHFKDNLADLGGSGGALAAIGATVRFDSCTFEHNAAQARGGAIAELGGGLLQLVLCTLVQNGVTGLDNFRGPALLGLGGAVSAASPVVAENCTFIWNTAAGGGGSAFFAGDGLGGALAANGPVQLFGCIFIDNRAMPGFGCPCDVPASQRTAMPSAARSITRR